MLKRVYWYDIAIKMRDYLKAYSHVDGTRLFDYLVDRDSLVIRVGTGNSGEYPAIFITFGEEGKVVNKGQNDGSQIVLYVDLYVKGGAEPASADYDDLLYRHQYMAQNELLKALEHFRGFLQRNKLANNLNVETILSDGGENAPVICASRVILTCEAHSNN